MLNKNIYISYKVRNVLLYQNNKYNLWTFSIAARNRTGRTCGIRRSIRAAGTSWYASFTGPARRTFTVWRDAIASVLVVLLAMRQCGGPKLKRIVSGEVWKKKHFLIYSSLWCCSCPWIGCIDLAACELRQHVVAQPTHRCPLDYQRVLHQGGLHLGGVRRVLPLEQAAQSLLNLLLHLHLPLIHLILLLQSLRCCCFLNI